MLWSHTMVQLGLREISNTVFSLQELQKKNYGSYEKGECMTENTVRNENLNNTTLF